MEKEEKIILTPKKKTSTSTTLWIERKVIEDSEFGKKVFVAGGDHQGILVNKQQLNDATETSLLPDVSLEFRVCLVNTQTEIQTKETRTLNFWFGSELKSDSEKATLAQEFFATLVHPEEFPRDYVGFIKKTMKLLQREFLDIEKIELVLSQIGNEEITEQVSDLEESNFEKLAKITEENLIEVIESVYPNLITVEDLAGKYKESEKEVLNVLNRLEAKGLVKQIECGSYTRIIQGDAEVKIVKQMPKIIRSHQPIVAIITAQFVEKIAVDAMMENKETFVRYTTIGESNVYTLGNLGNCRVVCTKLPAVGHSREATTAAGNSTTRLLGTFQNIDHVILVGTGGGVPHFTDYDKHVRLGDVVISHASSKTESIYVSCEEVTEIKPKIFNFEYKEYVSRDTILQVIGAKIKAESAIEGVDQPCQPWKHIDDGLDALEKQNEYNFKRPPPDSDRLYVAMGKRDVIEVHHPAPQNSKISRELNEPRLHLGLIGAGRDIAKTDFYRQKFAHLHGIVAYVPEFDPVIESIIGNCRDSFIFVRGISDYKDGGKKTRWQPYASLAAAATTKAIVVALAHSYASGSNQYDEEDDYDDDDGNDYNNGNGNV